MNNDKKVTNPDGANSDLQQRRRLLKRGLLLVPAIITLRAQPAMAATATNTYGYHGYEWNESGETSGYQPLEDELIETRGVFYTQEAARLDDIEHAPP